MTVELRLRLVAWTFLVTGILAVFVVLTTGNLGAGTALVAVPMGIGLLRKREAWRVFTLVVLWASLIATAAIVVFNFRSLSLDLGLFGRRMEYRSPWAVMAALVPFYAFTVWQVHVLMDSDTRRLFERSEEAGTS